MLGYELSLALRGLRRFPRSTVLVVVTVALGIASCMTSLLLLHVLSGDPLPGRSQHLYLAWVDTLHRPPRVDTSGMALNGVSANTFGYRRLKREDAEALMRGRAGVRQAIVADVLADESTEDGTRHLASQAVLATSSDFVALFGVPLLHGRSWTVAEETARAPVVLIDSDTAQRFYGTADAVGREVRLGKRNYRIIGVFAPYAPQPHFFGLDVGSFTGNGGENLLVPYTSALANGLMPMTGDGCDASVDVSQTGASDPAHCASLSLWVQLGTPGQVASYRTYLRAYADDHPGDRGKTTAARYGLYGVRQWLDMNGVVPASARLNVLMASSFLLLCMFNVIGLLTARFLRRSTEIGIRRALGASRLAVFAQHIGEATLVCLAGGLLALPMTELGAWILRRQGDDFSPLVRSDPWMFGALFAIAIVVGTAVGIVPAWRASTVEPGLQVKSE